MNNNRLTLNADKWVYIAFSNGVDMHPEDINIAINGKLLERVDKTKYLI